MCGYSFLFDSAQRRATIASMQTETAPTTTNDGSESLTLQPGISPINSLSQISLGLRTHRLPQFKALTTYGQQGTRWRRAGLQALEHIQNRSGR